MPLSNPTSGGAGPAGWHVADDGRIGIGSATYDAGCAVTLSGDGNLSLHGEQVLLTSPSSTPPSLSGGATVGLQTEGGASSIFLRSGSETTEFTAVSGTAASRGGHRFLTGSTPATRLCIADDGVVLDVPLLLQFCPVASLPSASAHPGALIVIPDRGAAIQLAFSNGLHWIVLGSDDII